jgi:hypothetical protein
MEKDFFYRGKKYRLEIIFIGNSYHAQIDDSGLFPIPLDYFNDISKIQSFLITIIENKEPLSILEKWDGFLYNS